MALAGLLAIPPALVGAGAGIVAGRWAWSLVSNRIGLASAGRGSWGLIAAAGALAILTALLVAMVPARAAGSASCWKACTAGDLGTTNRASALLGEQCVPDAVNSPATAPIIDPSVTSWTPDRLPIAVGTRFAIRGRLGSPPHQGHQRGDDLGTSTDPGTAGLAVYRSISPKLAA